MSRSLKTIVVSLVATFALGSACFAGDGLKLQQVIQKPRVNQVIRQVIDRNQPQQVVIGNPGQIESRQVVIDPGFGGQPVLAYFSRRLGARFEVQPIQIGNFAPVSAARIVSVPQPGSPLSQLGLEIGDIITRLDGIPIQNEQELDRHVYDTVVRFVKAGSNQVQQATMYVDGNRFFQETYYPPTHGGGHSGCPLRP